MYLVLCFPFNLQVLRTEFFISSWMDAPLVVFPSILLWFKSSTSFPKVPFLFLELKPGFALVPCIPAPFPVVLFHKQSHGL